MGWTRFTGPVYGAKQTLITFNAALLSSGANAGISTVAGLAIVPAGEDWYATEFNASRVSTGSTDTAFWVTDDSTVVSSVTVTSSLAEVNTINIITPDGGEKEGTKIAAGSTLRFHFSNSSAQGAIVGATWVLSGYRRFVDSSRSE